MWDSLNLFRYIEFTQTREYQAYKSGDMTYGESEQELWEWYVEKYIENFRDDVEFILDELGKVTNLITLEDLTQNDIVKLIRGNSDDIYLLNFTLEEYYFAKTDDGYVINFDSAYRDANLEGIYTPNEGSIHLKNTETTTIFKHLMEVAIYTIKGLKIGALVRYRGDVIDYIPLTIDDKLELYSKFGLGEDQYTEISRLVSNLSNQVLEHLEVGIVTNILFRDGSKTLYKKGEEKFTQIGRRKNAEWLSEMYDVNIDEVYKAQDSMKGKNSYLVIRDGKANTFNEGDVGYSEVDRQARLRIFTRQFKEARDNILR
mgnify:CR=1 FL=1